MFIPEGFGQINWMFGGTACPNGAQVTLGFRIDEPTDTPLDHAEAAAIAWQAGPANAQVDDCILQTVLVKHGPNETGPFGEFTSNTVGGSSSSGWTPQVSVLVRKITNTGGRSGRGRMFVPGYPENIAEVNGILDTGAQSAIQGQFEDLMADLVVANMTPVVLHSTDEVFAVPFIINAVQVADRVATQRRRIR